MFVASCAQAVRAGHWIGSQLLSFVCELHIRLLHYERQRGGALTTANRYERRLADSIIARHEGGGSLGVAVSGSAFHHPDQAPTHLHVSSIFWPAILLSQRSGSPNSSALLERQLPAPSSVLSTWGSSLNPATGSVIVRTARKLCSMYWKRPPAASALVNGSNG